MRGQVDLMLAAAALALAAGGCSAALGITAETSCRDYLGRPDEERAEAVRRIGVELGNNSAGNPMMFWSADSYCGSAPDSTIGAFLEPD